MKKGATKIDQYWLPATFLQKKISWQTIGYKTNGFPIFFPIDQFFSFFKYFPAKNQPKKFWRENSKM